MAPPSDLLKRLLANWPAKVIALGVALVVVLFNGLAEVSERYFSIPLQLRLADTVIAGSDHPNRVRVRLRGNEGQIFGVLESDLVAYADFTGQRFEGQFRAPVQVQRSGSALDIEALEITVEPLYVTVTLEEKLTRSVAVVPNIVGFPPPGYELSDYRVSPTTVTVVGPRSRLEGVTQVLTEVIGLGGRTSGFTERVRLVPPADLVEFPGGNIVDFRALIVETVVQVTYELDIVVADLAPELEPAAALPSGRIRVQGKQLDLDGLPGDRIGVYVDASGVTAEGTYQLPLRPRIPPGVLVLSLEPTRVELVVERRSVDREPEETR